MTIDLLNMKKLLLLFVAVLGMTACATWKNVPQRLDKLVDETAQTSSSYTDNDWETSKQRYQSLISEYAEHEDDYTDEQKSLVMKDIGRYHALLAVHSMSDAITFLRTMIHILPSYLKGILEVIRENKDALVDVLKEFLKELLSSWDVLKDILNDGLDFSQFFSDEFGALEE